MLSDDGRTRTATVLRASTGRRERPASIPASHELARARPQHFVWFTPALGLLLGGYLFFSKSFAYLHLPGTPFFVGEVVLAVGVVEVLRVRSPWRHLLHTSPVLGVLLLFMTACSLRLLSDLPRYRLDAVRDSSIWYYGAYAFLVAAVVVREPTFAHRLLSWYRQALPWFLLWAPIALIVAGIEAFSAMTVPGTSTPINSFKAGDFSVQVAVGIAFLWLGVDRVPGGPPMRRSTIILLSVVGVVTLGIAGSQTRGGLVAAVLLLVIAWACVPTERRRRLTLAVGSGLLLVIAVVLLLDLRIQGERRDVSLQQVGANLASVLGRETNDELAGTVEWRQGYWEQVLEDLTSSRAWVSGVGFGPILPERYEVTIDANNPQPLRNAHNSHLTLLARVGFFGFALWLALWVVCCHQFVRWIRLRHGRGRDPDRALAAWLIAAVPAFLINAFFDPSLDGPQAGIWLFVLVGLGAALTRATGRRRLGEA